MLVNRIGRRDRRCRRPVNDCISREQSIHGDDRGLDLVQHRTAAHNAFCNTTLQHTVLSAAPHCSTPQCSTQCLLQRRTAARNAKMARTVNSAPMPQRYEVVQHYTMRYTRGIWRATEVYAIHKAP